MVFQTTAVFSADVRVAGTALGKLWLFWGFVLVCREQAAEGQWACMKKKSLTNAEEPMLRYAQESISSPLHVRYSRCVSARSPLEEVPALSPQGASREGMCHTNIRLLQSVCHANYSSSGHTSVTSTLHTSRTKMHAREDSPPPEQSRTGWGGWLCSSGLHWEHQEKKRWGLLVLFINCTCHDLLSGWTCSVDKLCAFN